MKPRILENVEITLFVVINAFSTVSYFPISFPYVFHILEPLQKCGKNVENTENVWK